MHNYINLAYSPTLVQRMLQAVFNFKIMFELTHKEGFKVLAEYKDGLGWYDLDGYKLKEDCWVWSEELKQPITSANMRSKFYL